MNNIETPPATSVAKFREKRRTAATIFGIMGFITATTGLFLLWNEMLVPAVSSAAIALVLAYICLRLYAHYEKNIEEFEMLKAEIEVLVEQVKQEQLSLQEYNEDVLFRSRDLEERNKKEILSSQQRSLLILMVVVVYLALTFITPIFNRHLKIQELSFGYNMLYSTIIATAGVIDCYLFFFFAKRHFSKKAMKMRKKRVEKIRAKNADYRNKLKVNN
jgi:hypothetical protein